MNHNNLVILTGGSGSRLWPLSTSAVPKQFCDILGDGKSLLQATYSHYSQLIPPENVWILTTEAWKHLVIAQLPEVNPKHILCEPVCRNTAPAVAYASWRIKAVDPRANMLVVPSDSVVTDEEPFIQSIRQCLMFAAETDSIVALGIRPTRPELSYGYIETDLSYSSSRNSRIYRVDHFVEKPSLEAVEQYVKSNNTFWNTGIYTWSVNTIVNAYRVYQPALASMFEALLPVMGTGREAAELVNVYPKTENISLAYALLEKVEEIFVYTADYSWHDLDTWSSLDGIVAPDIYNNVLKGNVEVSETNNCIIHVPGLKRVVVQGLENFIVSEHDGVLLICSRDEEQRIRVFGQDKNQKPPDEI